MLPDHLEITGCVVCAIERDVEYELRCHCRRPLPLRRYFGVDFCICGQAVS
jgi:hypothetical protein